ncbi:MAG: right-handed parallel beta-helix repeat-containing protein [Propionibacteriaceae bacterium]|nr:right-handed parallel beta-helix repeat-containing protein [Propionibacteriaceae bacterium]
MKPSRLATAVVAALTLLLAALLSPSSALAQGPALEVAPSGGDDTAAIQQVIDRAAAQRTGVRLRPGARYTTTAELELKLGLTSFDGRGATIVAKLPDLGKPGNVFRFSTHSKGIKLTEVGIDLSGSVKETRGVLAAAVEDVEISKLRITGSRYRAIDVVANHGPVRRVHVHTNTVTGPQGTKSTEGSQAISVTSHTAVEDRFTGMPAAVYDRFRETGTVAAPKHEATQVRIEDNRIDGGYYGISLSGATGCQIFGNTSTNNVRNLSMQDRSSNNHVRNNDFNDSESSAVHLAYGSSNNIVEHNRITTSRAHGQGLLQAYQGSTGNTFRHNRVVASGQARPSWFMYVATGSHNTVFQGNTLIGKAGSAVAAAESIWDRRSAVSRGFNPNPHSYSGNRTTHPGTGKPVDFAGGSGDLRGVAFIGNTLATQGQPFYLGAEVTLGPEDTKPAVGNLIGVRISGNQLKGSGYTSPIVEHRGSLPKVGTASISYAEKQ